MASSKVPAESIAANSKCAEVILTLSDDTKQEQEEREIDVPMRLEKIFQYVNDTTNESKLQTKWIIGLRNARKEHQVERSLHFLNGGNDEVFKILCLDAIFKFIDNKESYTRKLSEQEIYDTKEMTASVTVAPMSKLIRWQLVSNVLGHDIGHDHIIDTSEENGDKFALDSLKSKCVAKILVPRKIFYGETQVRIKHKAQDKFLTIVTRKGWPAATLGLNSQFYFVLHKTPQGIKIKAKNTTVPDYDVLYSSDYGAIYFDRWTTGLEKQCWTISKADPLFIGDTVSFMNKWWNDSGLCFNNGQVCCARNKEDEWVLTV